MKLSWVAPVLLAACAGGLGAPPGQAALAPAEEAELKTLAVRGFREELQRSMAGGPAGFLVFLDTMVGPTPQEYMYDWLHRREWLEAMVATRLVDQFYGPRGDRDHLFRRGAVVEVGAPFPAGRDSIAILYDWCLRIVPSRDGSQGSNISVWRDTFVRGDTGWVRVLHTPTVAPVGCTR